MDTYSLLRAFADSWALLALFSLFVGVVIWAFWPGQARARNAAAAIPFQEEGPHPLPDSPKGQTDV